MYNPLNLCINGGHNPDEIVSTHYRVPMIGNRSSQNKIGAQGPRQWQENKVLFNTKTLKTVLQKKIEEISAKYKSDQVLAGHQKGERLYITQYINVQEIEKIVEGIISQLGGCAREQGMVFVSVKDKNGCFVTPDNNCDKIIVSVAYGQELIINNREYPPEKNGAGTTESSPIFKQTRSTIPASAPRHPKVMPEKALKPVAIPGGTPTDKADLDDDHIRAKQLQLAKELQRNLDELWINRNGLGVDFNNPGALRIELQDSARITKITQELGGKKLAVKIDPESGLINIYDESKIYLKWKFPENKT